jgi:CelD/BcsL family acetyltransferase involved in cellulose biosynthesis
VHSPFATIGKRHLIDTRVGPRAPDPATDRGRDGDRVGGSFERLGSDDDPRRGHTGMICILRDILTASDPVCIARDPKSLETTWSELARRRAHPTVFLTPEWLAVARAHDPREQVTLEIGKQGVAALAREKDGTITFAGGELTDEQDVIARASDAKAVAGALAAWITEQRIGRVVVSYVPEEVPTLEALRQGLAANGYDARIERLVTSPRLDLPSDFPTYLQGLGKKERHELRRKMRRLETGRDVRFRFADPRERVEILDRFFELHRRSRGEKAHFMTAENERFFRDVADALASRDWLRLGVLEVDGSVSAALFGWRYEGSMALYNTAYDPDLAPLSVGIISHAYAIRDAIAEGVRGYDLLRGGEPYKYDLGAEDHWLGRLEAERR